MLTINFLFWNLKLFALWQFRFRSTKINWFFFNSDHFRVVFSVFLCKNIHAFVTFLLHRFLIFIFQVSFWTLLKFEQNSRFVWLFLFAFLRGCCWFSIYWGPFNNTLNLSECQSLPFLNLCGYTFLKSLLGIKIGKSAIFTSHIRQDNFIVGDFDFSMCRWYLTIFDDDGRLLGYSSDDVLSLINGKFIFEWGMILDDKVTNYGFRVKHKV